MTSRIFRPTAPVCKLFRPALAPPSLLQPRWAHAGRGEKTVPPPIPLVPDVETFLKVIGRDLKQHAEKFPSWDSLFALTSPQLKDLGVEPARSRRYLLRWLHRFRLGLFGPGGDFRHVAAGRALLQVATVERGCQQDLQWVVNVPPGASADDLPPEERVKVQGYSVRGARSISGPFALPLKKGDGSVVEVTEGMWEHKRGRKIDGGERRRAEVRFKRKVAERKAAREAGGYL